MVPPVEYANCGEMVEKQVRPPVPELGGALAYISMALSR